MSVLSLLDHPGRPWSPKTLHFCKYTHNILAFEEHFSQKELSDDAANTPHINFFIIRTSQNNFRSPIASCLNIETGLVMEKDARPDIYHLELAFGVRFNEDILWFEVSVDNMKVMKLLNSQKHLLGIRLYRPKGEMLLVHFVSIKEVILEELSDQHQMFFVIKEIIKSQ